MCVAVAGLRVRADQVPIVFAPDGVLRLVGCFIYSLVS